MPKYRVLLYERTPHARHQRHLTRQALPPGRHARLPGAHRPPRRRGDLIPGVVRRAPDEVAAGRGDIAAPPRSSICARRRGGEPRRRRLAPPRRRPTPRCSKAASTAWIEAGPAAGPRGGAAAARRRRAGRVWVTRARPKVDRIACPWLIRRFVDPAAIFLFVAPPEVAGVGERLRRRAVRRRGRVLEPSRRTLHLRHDGRGVRPRPACRARRGSRSSCAAPTPPAPSSRRRRRACSPPRSACRASMPTISSSSRRACRLRRLLPLVPRRGRRDPRLGVPHAQSAGAGVTAALAEGARPDRSCSRAGHRGADAAGATGWRRPRPASARRPRAGRMRRRR